MAATLKLDSLGAGRRTAPDHAHAHAHAPKRAALLFIVPHTHVYSSTHTYKVTEHGGGTHPGDITQCSSPHLPMAMAPSEGSARTHSPTHRLTHTRTLARVQNMEVAQALKLDAVLEPAGALHLPMPTPTEEGAPQPLSGAAFATMAPSSDHEYKPEWRLVEANDLKKRADSLLRLQRFVWRVVTANRLRKNLGKIQEVRACGNGGWWCTHA